MTMRFASIFTVITLLTFSSCLTFDTSIPDLEFKEEMRQFVINLSTYAEDQNADFLMIPQNGLELITENGESDDFLHDEYLAAIDGQGQEGLFFGYDKIDRETKDNDREYLDPFVDKLQAEGIPILITDYCAEPENINESYIQNDFSEYISFAADNIELNSIPEFPAIIHHENDADVFTLDQAQNFLYLLNPSLYASKDAFLEALLATNYDVLILDLFYDDDALTDDEVEQLKVKNNGGSRLVVAYMSIGEAQDYRYYWDSDWTQENTLWLEDENRDMDGSFAVRYWELDWKDIIYGSSDAYLDQILDAGFDGVYLDKVDIFEEFED